MTFRTFCLMNDRRGQMKIKVCDSCFFYFLFYIFDVTLLIEKITVTYEKQTVYCICSFISMSVAVTRTGNVSLWKRIM